MMLVKAVRKTQIVHPTGDPKFAVQQAFPAGFSAEESDPFLMCDFFSAVSKGVETNPDKFPVGWHPHRGMDICTYMKEGVGRHADSLGNRGTFSTPGLQWISVGSGIEHAEAGGTLAGQKETGFQIWINVPSHRKMDNPRYGTVPTEALPVLGVPGVYNGRLLAGEFDGLVGPFKTVVPILILDVEMAPNASQSFYIPAQLDNVIVLSYKGAGTICARPVVEYYVIRLEAMTETNREVVLTSEDKGMSVMIFAGKQLRQPIAWHGPFVMTTDEEIRRTIYEYQTGTFLRVAANWNYKVLADFPARFREQSK